jgi:hypothetical protein
MTGAGVGAGHTRGLAFAGERAGGAGLAVVERGHRGNSEHTADALEVGWLARVEVDLAAPAAHVTISRRWRRIGALLDLARCPVFAVSGEDAHDVSRR